MDELHALKQEAGHLLATGANALRQASSRRAKVIATDRKAFLTDFRDALDGTRAACLSGMIMRELPGSDVITQRSNHEQRA